MKKVIKYIIFSIVIILSFALFFEKSIKKNITNLLLSQTKMFVEAKTPTLIKNINNRSILEFKENYNLSKVFYMENGKIKYSSLITEIGKKYKLKKIPEISREEFLKKGSWLKDKDKLLYYIPIESYGFLVININLKNEYQRYKKIENYILEMLIYSLIIVFMLVFLYYLYNFYHPMNELKKFIYRFRNPLENGAFDKKFPDKFNGDFNEVTSLFNTFLNKIYSKIDMIEADRKAMRRTYELMKLKNTQLLSLYEFANDLSFDIELEKIYVKIKEIMTGIMNSGVVIILLKDEKQELNVEYLYGVSKYENKIDKNSIEKIAEKYGKTIRVKDAYNDKRVDFSKMVKQDQEKLQEFTITPLSTNGEVIGFLIVDKIFNKKLKNIEEVTTLNSIGEITARAIKKALKYKEMNVGLNMASILYKITTLVETNEDLYEIFKMIIQSIKRVVDYSSAAIYLINSKNELEEVPEYREGEKDELLESIEFKLGKGMKAVVAQRKDTIIIRDVSKSTKGLQEMFKASNEHIASFASVPMLIENRLVGVINLTHDQANKFREEDKMILKLFANQAASTIEKIKKDRKIEKLLAKVTNESITDPLTQLYNRRYMMRRLGEEIARGKRENVAVSLIGIDIDFFKKFNDTYGHQIGDLVLKHVGIQIKKSLRVIDIPCRYGGEELFVILPNTNMQGAYKTAERIRYNIENMKLKHKNLILNVTVSVGVSIYPTNALDSESLIKTTDLALYKAKESGRNRVIVYGN
ncbi:sensor domain-containing diguanylate cyclase [Haliovirga abyssi]|uniref:GGDEF domain-containing protein n=1 Tax=Haliovirga abyssi TaxID=2996794 RepID=A0AAU9D8K0_9FUSO|nr:diguanylate cyclase [Haliovirga abyssi]BDU50928.1 hypothetical protein HLVA_14970 [Haliovirga abyssi]